MAPGGVESREPLACTVVRGSAVAGLDELPRWGWQAWTLTLASAIVHLAYFNSLLAGYRAADMTVVYPVARGSGPLISALVAVVLLDEHLGLGGTLGLAGVVVLRLCLRSFVSASICDT